MNKELSSRGLSLMFLGLANVLLSITSFVNLLRTDNMIFIYYVLISAILNFVFLNGIIKFKNDMNKFING